MVTRNLGVSENYASFAVPIGATTKMDGCAAVYPALAAITVAQLFGVPLGVTDYLLIAFVSVVGSAGSTAGITGAVVMLTLTLSTLGLPLEGVGLLLAIDPILDMMRTATNVAGQALVPTIVAKRNGLLDLDVYNGASIESIDSDPRRGAGPGQLRGLRGRYESKGPAFLRFQEGRLQTSYRPGQPRRRVRPSEVSTRGLPGS